MTIANDDLFLALAKNSKFVETSVEKKQQNIKRGMYQRDMCSPLA